MLWSTHGLSLGNRYVFSCDLLVTAWLRLILKQEIRNITWIAECIAQNQKERIGNYISVF